MAVQVTIQDYAKSDQLELAQDYRQRVGNGETLCRSREETST